MNCLAVFILKDSFFTRSKIKEVEKITSITVIEVFKQLHIILDFPFIIFAYPFLTVDNFIDICINRWMLFRLTIFTKIIYIFLKLLFSDDCFLNILRWHKLNMPSSPSDSSWTTHSSQVITFNYSIFQPLWAFLKCSMDKPLHIALLFS